MRAFFVLIVVVAAAYLGWTFHRQTRPVSPGEALKVTPGRPAATAPARPASSPVAARAVRPGVFYALERISKRTETGVKALTPGEEVKLMYRYRDGTMRVTNGQDEFRVKSAVLTPDPERAFHAASR